jgi:hypothetical protein
MRRRRYRKRQICCEVTRQFLPSTRILLQLKHYARIVAVMTPREAWTDERLDDLNRKVDDGFARLDTDIRELRRDVNARFDSLNRNLLAGLIAIVAAVIGSNVL